MQVIGDYYGNGYAHLRTLLPREVAHEFLAQLKASLEESKVPLRGFFRPAQMLKRPALEIYSQQYKPMSSLLWGLTPTMSELTKRDLLPTYCYFRVYRGGDLCWVHSDRYACEHSLSLTLGYSDEKPWAFEIGREKLTHVRPVETTFEQDAYNSVDMDVGDAILYQGVAYRHGRVTPNPNRWSAHLFLHWVDRAGPYSREAFDGKATKDVVDFDLS